MPRTRGVSLASRTGLPKYLRIDEVGLTRQQIHTADCRRPQYLEPHLAVYLLLLPHFQHVHFNLCADPIHHGLSLFARHRGRAGETGGTLASVYEVVAKGDHDGYNVTFGLLKGAAGSGSCQEYVRNRVLVGRVNVEVDAVNNPGQSAH